MSVARRVAYNTAVQVVGRVIGLLVVLVTVNYIANHLVVNGSALRGFGQYSIVFAYVSIIGAAADLGLFTLVVREITGRPSAEAGRIIGSALGFRILLMLLMVVVAALAYPVLPYDPVVKQGIIIGVVIAFSMLFSQVISSIFQANLVTERIAISELTGKIVIAVLTITVLRAGYGLTAIIWANLVGQLITFGLAWAMARSFVLVPISFDLSLLKKAGPQFWSLAIISVLGLIHFKIDSIILSLFKGEAEVGIYGLAYKLLEIILIIPAIFVANLLPVMTSVIDAGKSDELASIVRRSAQTILIVATAITLVVFCLAPEIIIFVSQPDFLAAAAPLRVLLFAALFVFITTLVAQVAVSGRIQDRLVKVYVAVVILDLLLYLYAIPRYSYMGAATVTAVSEAVLMIVTIRVVSRHLPTGLSLSMISRLTAGVILTALLVYWPVRHWFLSPLTLANYGKVIQALYLVGTSLGITAVFAAMLWLCFGGSNQRLRDLLYLKGE